ncbi:hypothetical protein Tco_1308567 [Tanacetum coccineum]
MKHSIEEIVSHDEEEEVESFQDKYEHADQKHKLIKMIQDKEMMQDESSQALKCAGFDTRPPMLDRSDFESWQQHIRLYCLGKDNGENIFKLIDESPFKTGKFRETLVEGAEGALHLGPERDRVFADLTPEEKKRV